MKPQDRFAKSTAWFTLHRQRDAWDESSFEKFVGPVEADETYIGGKRKNMPNSKRKEMEGWGSVGKSAIVGSTDRKTNKVVARHLPITNANHAAV